MNFIDLGGPQIYMYPQNQTIDPYSLPPFWHGPSTGRYGQGTPFNSSSSKEINGLTNSVNQFQANMSRHGL